MIPGPGCQPKGFLKDSPKDGDPISCTPLKRLVKPLLFDNSSFGDIVLPIKTNSNEDYSFWLAVMACQGFQSPTGCQVSTSSQFVIQ